MSNEIVIGSQQDIANRQNISLAESFLSAEIVILFDNSGSMAMHDTADGRSRLEVAEEHLTTIQGKHPGKVALICFADKVQYAPGGRPVFVGTMTDLVSGLQFVKVADDCGLKIVVVSDGEPNDKDAALRVAKQFTSKIDVVFVGPENDWAGGRAFLQQLANATGGRFFQADQPGMLADSVETLLLGG
jgi:Mg-chelatase subunit ChlD